MHVWKEEVEFFIQPSLYTRVGLLVPGGNCGCSEPDAERGADLKFEIEFKKRPQSVDRTKPPRSCVGSEPGDALKGYRVDS
jgi:hypothetical protein